ncbi:MAG: RNA 2',3'-cyclic phosphodiesterase [Nitrospirae bacterium]|nr:RNA 2',3'-cyclic phosphodiesterase [Nitrospirota bacterium]
MTIRSFIAIKLPEGLKRSIADLITELRNAGSDVSWVQAGNIHLTLRFLGSTDNALIPAIKERISKKLLHYSTFYIKIGGVGCFPSQRRPRVLWIGIENSDALKNMQKEVDLVVSEFGFEAEERPFSPHLTIGRVRSQRGIAETIRRFTEFRTADFGTFEVERIHIMKSELKPAGAQHTSIAEIPIGRGRNNVEGIEQRTE